MCQSGCGATHAYKDDLSDSTFHCIVNTLDEYRPYSPVGQEGTSDHHKGTHEYCAEAIIVKHIVQYKWEYNRALKVTESLVASYTCYMHSHFTVDIEGHVSIKILVRALKTGTTAKKELELYFPKTSLTSFVIVP